jgi:hypothetical protein
VLVLPRRTAGICGIIIGGTRADCCMDQWRELGRRTDHRSGQTYLQRNGQEKHWQNE